MQPSDLIRVARAAMHVDRASEAWLAGMCAALQATRPHASGTIGYSFELGPAGITLDVSYTSGAAIAAMNVSGLAALSEAQRTKIFGKHATATTAVREFGGRLPDGLAREWAALNVQDVFGLIATTANGTGILVATIEPEVVDEPIVKSAQTLIGSLKSSLALRRSLAGTPLDRAVSAIFEPDGTIEAVDPGVRAVDLATVQALVREREGARRRAEREDMPAWQVWQDLCAGRYRLVDYVDNDGKRFVVMVEDCDGCAPALTPLESRIAELCGQARGNKQIGFELGLTETAVANHVARVLAKLGLDHRVDLVRLYTGFEQASCPTG